DSVLERMLLALRDRIPLKLAQEGPGKAKGREKTQVDVFRGADYQMAFFFRRASDKHVVLLKHKHFYEATGVKRAESSPRAGDKRARSPSRERSETPRASKRAHGPGPGPGTSWPIEPRSLFAPPSQGDENDGEGDDDVIVVKDEPVEDDVNGLPPPPPPPRPEPSEDLGQVKLEDDDEFSGDVKPELKVTYQSYKIFGRTLVVIVEPYPPLDPKDLARPLQGLSTEVRQLSASVAPDSYRRRTAAAAAAAAASRSSISVTPAPAPETRPGGGLFRREETEDAQSLRGSVTPSLTEEDRNDDDLYGGGGRVTEKGEEEDEQMRALRATSTLLANEWPQSRGGVEGVDGEAELPSLEAILERSRRG
ncbi:hypothetical protein JCM3774_003125, partial [Rhodotorula dairenensis]